MLVLLSIHSKEAKIFSICSDLKRGSCNPWNSTSPREAHENVLIKNGFPLMCALGKNKIVRPIGPKVVNIYTVGGGALQMVSGSCPSWECGSHMQGRVCL